MLRLSLCYCDRVQCRCETKHSTFKRSNDFNVGVWLQCSVTYFGSGDLNADKYLHVDILSWVTQHCPPRNSMPNHVGGASTFSRCLTPSQGTVLYLSHCQLIEAERLFYHIEPPGVISHHPETAFTVTSGNKALSQELWASGTSIERQWQESQLLQIPGSQGSVRNHCAVPDSRLKHKYSNCEIGINLANKTSKWMHYVELCGAPRNRSGGAIQGNE